MTKSEIEKLAKKLIAQHLPPSWKFRWTKAQSFFGRCVYSHLEIELSEALIPPAPREFIEDTILHEIAHALCPGHGHDKVWKKAAVRLGAAPKGVDSYEGFLDHIQWKYAIVHADTGEVLRKYIRKPNRKTIEALPKSFMPGVPNSYGKLALKRLVNNEVQDEVGGSE